MNEERLDAPGPRPEFAPKRGARNNLHPTDQTGEALIAMLLEASRVLRDNDHRLVHSSSRLSARFHHAAAEATDLLKDLIYGTFLRAGDPPYARLACGKSDSLCCGPP